MKRIILSLLVLAGSAMAIELGKVPPAVSLSGENGAKVTGATWDSASLKGKVHVVFYVDPDKKDVNTPLTIALKQRHFNRDKYASVAIINLAATWMPNAILETKLKSKQKEFPDTIYVKDKKKVLVEKWQLADDASNVLIFGKDGKLLYQKAGKHNRDEIKAVLNLIEKNL